MLGYFSVSIIHRTPTWTARSLTCICDLFACIYTHGTSVYSLVQTCSVCAEFDSRESQGGRKAEHVTVTRPLGDHARSCWTLAFESKYSCATDSQHQSSALLLCFSLWLTWWQLFQLFCVEYYSPHSDWMKLLGWWAARNHLLRSVPVHVLFSELNLKRCCDCFVIQNIWFHYYNFVRGLVGIFVTVYLHAYGTDF